MRRAGNSMQRGVAVSKINTELKALFVSADREIELSRDGWGKRNAGLGRVAARRAAGMAIRAWVQAGRIEGYGTNFMHHLAAFADDEGVPLQARESAWRLANRPAPDGGFVASDPMPTEPADDAETIRMCCLELLQDLLDVSALGTIGPVKSK